MKRIFLITMMAFSLTITNVSTKVVEVTNTNDTNNVFRICSKDDFIKLIKD